MRHLEKHIFFNFIQCVYLDNNTVPFQLTFSLCSYFSGETLLLLSIPLPSSCFSVLLSSSILLRKDYFHKVVLGLKLTFQDFYQSKSKKGNLFATFIKQNKYFLRNDYLVKKYYFYNKKKGLLRINSFIH